MSRVIADVTEAPEAVFARTDVEVRNYLMSPSLGLLNLFGRLARRPKVLRRLASRRWFGNIYIGAAGK